MNAIGNIRDTCIIQLERKALGRHNNDFPVVFLTPVKLPPAKMFPIVTEEMQRELPDKENSCILKCDTWENCGMSSELPKLY